MVEGITPDAWDWRNPAVYKKIRAEHGDEAQVIQTIQELAELTQALTQYQLVDIKRHSYLEVIEHCIEELADAQLMLYQMMDLFGREFVEQAMEKKLERLRNRMLKNGMDISMKNIPRGRSKITQMQENPRACPLCGSPDFKIHSIQAGLVVYTCNHCWNTFPAPGDWTFVDEKDNIKVRKSEEGDI